MTIRGWAILGANGRLYMCQDWDCVEAQIRYSKKQVQSHLRLLNFAKGARPVRVTITIHDGKP